LANPGLAVAAHLAQYAFTLKTSPKPSRFDPRLKEPIPEKLSFSPLEESKEWDRGVIYGQSQNLARTVRSFRLWDVENLLMSNLFSAHGVTS